MEALEKSKKTAHPQSEISLASLRAETYNAVLSEISDPSPGLRIIRVTPDDGKVQFEPGQFTTLGLFGGESGVTECLYEDDSTKEGKLLQRAYSMSHPMCDEKTGKLLAPEEIGYLEFYIVLVNRHAAKPPLLTPRLFALGRGARLHLGKITGNYHLDSEDLENKKHLIFCATGTGEAPHNAMIWKLLSEKYEGRITCIVCARTHKDLAYRAHYEKLQKQYPNLSYVTLVTREEAMPKLYIQDYLEQGKLEKLLRQPLSPQKHAIYLCGNPGMIGAPKGESTTDKKSFPTGKIGMIELLQRRGFSEKSIHYERYW